MTKEVSDRIQVWFLSLPPTKVRGLINVSLGGSLGHWIEDEGARIGGSRKNRMEKTNNQITNARKHNSS